MIEIENTVVSFDVFEHLFCCDLDRCKGACCIEGDAGAPISEEEVLKINNALPNIRHLLTPKALEVIDKQGISYVDQDGDLVTSLVNNRECVFSFMNGDICFCALEKAFNEGSIDFPKPISCHLYPVRLEEFKNFTAVNVHRWSCCQSAEICGKEKNIPVYKFLEYPLIRHFGKKWYNELEKAAKVYYNEFKQKESNLN